MYAVTPSLSKENILRILGQEQVMSRYTGMSIQPGVFTSPLREDKNPSCSFYTSDKGILYLRDWSLGQSYDCFSVVMIKHNCNFFEALKRINEDFELKLGSGFISTNAPSKPLKPPRKKKEKVFKYTTEEFTKEDLAWWASFGVTKELLNWYGVLKGKTVHLNGILHMRSTKMNPIYIYTDFPEGRIKIYRPMSPAKSNKWRSTATALDLSGYNQLPRDGRLLIITSSLKDAMCLKNLGFSAISAQGESNHLNDEILAELKARFSFICTLFDNDDAGLAATGYFASWYSTIPLYFSHVGIPKDISDYYRRFGRILTHRRIKKIVSRGFARTKVEDIPFYHS